MGRSVIRTVKPHNEVIDWTDINLSATPSDILWQTFHCAPNGEARIAIQRELSRRKEF